MAHSDDSLGRRSSASASLMLLIISFALLVRLANGEVVEKELTFTVSGGSKDCFYQSVQIGQTIDLDYQVIDGGVNELDINFEMIEPITGRILYADLQKSDNVHRHRAIVAGDYGLCFDNSASRFASKTVFFELLVESDDGVEVPNGRDSLGDGNWPLDGLSPEEFYDMKIEDIQSSIGRVRAHLTKARQTQDMLRSFEARDRNIAEENNSLVMGWSIMQMLVMIGIGVVQIYMVRSLFDTNGRTTIWKRLKM